MIVRASRHAGLNVERRVMVRARALEDQGWGNPRLLAHHAFLLLEERFRPLQALVVPAGTQAVKRGLLLWQKRTLLILQGGRLRSTMSSCALARRAKETYRYEAYESL